LPISFAQKKSPRYRSLQNQGGAVTDLPRQRYEILRDSFLQGIRIADEEAFVQFLALGFCSLFSPKAGGAYVVEVYEARLPPWSGKRDPHLDVLRQVYGMLTKEVFTGITRQYQRRCA
jgi:hypothetical protein